MQVVRGLGAMLDVLYLLSRQRTLGIRRRDSRRGLGRQRATIAGGAAAFAL
ncbi:MAG TPA: hypothetical protein VN635_02290 [Conexibacter sp.]|nr:hypothetical protein [Conexibacter sp.]